jgi:hypothetical protein
VSDPTQCKRRQKQLQAVFAICYSAIQTPYIAEVQKLENIKKIILRQKSEIRRLHPFLFGPGKLTYSLGQDCPPVGRPSALALCHLVLAHNRHQCQNETLENNQCLSFSPAAKLDDEEGRVQVHSGTIFSDELTITFAFSLYTDLA